MRISQAITNTNEGPTKGDLAYACMRNQSQAHSLMLRAVRDSGLSQKELARRTGIDEATISRALSRPRNIELNTLSKLLYAASGSYLTLALFVPTQPAAGRVHPAGTGEEQSSGARTFVCTRLSSSVDAQRTSATTGTGMSRVLSLSSSNTLVREVADA